MTEAESARADFQHGQNFVFGVLVETIAPHAFPQGNAIVKRGSGKAPQSPIARTLLLEAPHLADELWAEAVRAVVYTKNRRPTDVPNGKAALEAREGQPLGRAPNTYISGGILVF